MCPYNQDSLYATIDDIDVVRRVLYVWCTIADLEMQLLCLELSSHIKWGKQVKRAISD